MARVGAEVTAWLLSFLWKPVAALLAAWGVWYAGSRSARQRAKIRGLEADKAANERITHADVSSGNADDDAKWLRDRAGK